MQQQMRRRGFAIGLLSLGVLAGVALSASPAQAASGPGPYYAEPAWDQKLPAATRFLVLTDWNSEAVLDKDTGLVWEKSPTTTTTSWYSALGGRCLNKSVGGRKGWRVPSIPELASLIDPSATSIPRLPAGHPFLNVQAANYWSATTNADSPGFAWLVNFVSGNAGGDLKSGLFHAWCVRGGMNADQY